LQSDCAGNRKTFHSLVRRKFRHSKKSPSLNKGNLIAFSGLGLPLSKCSPAGGSTFIDLLQGRGLGVQVLWNRTHVAGWLWLNLKPLHYEMSLRGRPCLYLKVKCQCGWLIISYQIFHFSAESSEGGN